MGGIRLVGDSGAHAAILRGLLENLCSEGIYATGVQAAVVAGPDRPVMSFSVGENVPGYPLTPSHLFNVWCASRPILVCAFLRAAERSQLRPEDSVGAVLRDVGSHLDGLTWASVLNHSAGIVSPSLLDASLMSTRPAIDLALRAVPTGEPGYSDFVLNVLLVRAIEELSGESASAQLGRSLQAQGLANAVKFGLGPAEMEAPLERIGFYTYGLPASPVPLYHDGIEAVACHHRDLFGAYASASGLARFYALLGSVASGRVEPGMPSPATLATWLGFRRGVEYDSVLRRDCDFACGLMMDLEQHAFGVSLSPNSFGHSGLMGSPFGFHDPETELSGAIILNGLQPGHWDLDYLRPLLVSRAVEWASSNPDS